MLNFMPTQEIQLRDYQDAAIEGLRDGIRAGKKRQILCASTGAGKTVMAASLLKEADRKGSYALFLVDRVALVNQTSAVMDEYGIAHGVIQGMNDRFMPHQNVQVCSIQTLARRSLPRDPDLLIWDECHSQYAATKAYIESNQKAVCIGLTATPFTKGMGEFWDGVVNVIPARRLIESGHLIEPKIYVAKSPEDAELGLNSYGEFSDASATSAGIQIIGDVVQEWIDKTTENFGGAVKTIVFSPTVEHGRELCASFSQAGYNFQQVSYLDRDDDERAAKIAEFRKPDSTIHGLVSCGVLTKGFDVPDVQCAISCKPYRKSLSSFMQEMGRIMRPHGGGKRCIWLCHSGNVERFAVDMFDVWENGVGELDVSTKRDAKARDRNEQIREQVVCPECSGAMRGPTCTVCGYERPARSGVNNIQGVMQEFVIDDIMQPRDGLRAEILKEPRKVWEGCLRQKMDTMRDPDQARKAAYAQWKGIYPSGHMGFGWFDMQPPAIVDQAAYALAERETRRFRKNSKRRRA
jgi:superfamily II DNA or RNA helicase